MYDFQEDENITESTFYQQGVDQEGSWTKKGSDLRNGYKKHIAVNSKEGLVVTNTKVSFCMYYLLKSILDIRWSVKIGIIVLIALTQVHIGCRNHRIHNSETTGSNHSLICSHCPQRFAIQSDLDAHQTKEHPLCSFCPQRFVTQPDLDTHQTKEHPLCSFYPQRFATQPDLDTHQTKEHPFLCEF